MAASFVSGLPGALRESWSMVVAGVNQGLSGNRIQKMLTDVGKGVRRQTLLDAIRVIKNGFQSDREYALLAENARPPKSLIQKAATKIRREYSWKFEITEVLQGKSRTRNVTLSTDSTLTRAQATERMLDALSENEYGYGEVGEVQSIGFVGIRRHP